MTSRSKYTFNLPPGADLKKDNVRWSIGLYGKPLVIENIKYILTNNFVLSYNGGDDILTLTSTVEYPANYPDTYTRSMTVDPEIPANVLIYAEMALKGGQLHVMKAINKVHMISEPNIIDILIQSEQRNVAVDVLARQFNDSYDREKEKTTGMLTDAMCMMVDILKSNKYINDTTNIMIIAVPETYATRLSLEEIKIAKSLFRLGDNPDADTYYAQLHTYLESNEYFQTMTKLEQIVLGYMERGSVEGSDQTAIIEDTKNKMYIMVQNIYKTLATAKYYQALGFSVLKHHNDNAEHMYMQCLTGHFLAKCAQI